MRQNTTWHISKVKKHIFFSNDRLIKQDFS